MKRFFFMSYRTIIILLLSIASISVQAATFTVLNTNDSGAGSLRQAIINANGAPNSIINFAIGTEDQTINLLSLLPNITTSGTIINGPTDEGNPRVVINAGGYSFGLRIVGVSNCEINNLVINNATGALISIEKTGALTPDGNKVSGCFLGTNQLGTAAGAGTPGYGIFLSGAPNTTIENNLISGAIRADAGYGIYVGRGIGTALGTIIKGNRIGTDKSGTFPIANRRGIALETALVGIVVGGSTAEERNVISGNIDNGIHCFSMKNTSIQGNYIGTDITGQEALGNGGNGIFLSSNAIDNTITDNIIGNNGGVGISIISAGNTVRNNSIGTDVTGQLDLGNTGNGITISTLAATKNMIGGTTSNQHNTIAYNGGYGVSVSAGTLNSILGNSLYSNANSGILLSSGGNASQAAPIIKSVVFTETQVTVVAQAPLLPTSSNFRLEFFINDNDVARFPFIDGETFLGAREPVVSGQEVTETFDVTSLAAERYISVTATNLNNTGSYGDTSMLTRAYTTYTVVNTNDSGDGSLRQAIINANADLGSRIEFEISGSGVKTITLVSDLPPITASRTIIDGSTQSGWSSDTPMVVIAGNENAYGLHIIDANNCEIRNLIINNADQLVRIEASSGTASGNKVLGCFLGTNQAGTSGVGISSYGITLEGATNTTIGGSEEESRNIISSNGSGGIFLSASTTNTIQGNYIGTGVNAVEELGNGGEGILLDANSSDNSIIDNVIGKNTVGLSISSNDNSVQRNFIGTNSARIAALGNTGNGITVIGNNNKIGGTSSTDCNTIAYNGGYGVSVSTGTLNSILSNSLYNNTNSGILLESGGNASQAAPIIQSVTSSKTEVTIVAQAPESLEPSNFRLEFFVNEDINGDSITDGRTFLGAEESVPSGQKVTSTFEVTSSMVGKYVSATATNLNNIEGALGDTSMLNALRLSGTASSTVTTISAKYY